MECLPRISVHAARPPPPVQMQSPLIRSVQIRVLCQGSYRFARAYHWRATERRNLPSAVPNVDFYYFANGRALILAEEWGGWWPGFMLGSAWRTALRWVGDKYWDGTPVTREVCFRKDLWYVLRQNV
ncbi:hypothetical protein CEXT_75891 [Caerostris extrusa]|uniref:Uncharacterized protein n=1 Tax=Caerostris extrusa TaxID=172846 RepID=A0AAV4WWR7_CAEEX|nr:hypothetical protein CEXT_75891 [Caerostris extrusa]